MGPMGHAHDWIDASAGTAACAIPGCQTHSRQYISEQRRPRTACKTVGWR
jgi:hypothetical protein